ncbi:MAG: hypothetical protein PHQ18_05275 [Patescibacteria group bacterium]|nr:hypothetical protein [Patescibacteria group bacterium]
MRFISALFAIALIASTSTPTQAQSYGFVNAEAKVDTSDIVPTFNALWGKSLVGQIGIEAFFLHTKGWEEVYVGPTWTPLEGLTFGLSGGIQRVDEQNFEPRFATSVLGSYEGFSFLGIFEWDLNGVSGLWYKAIASYQVTDWLKLGVEGRRFKGIGPHVSAALWNTKLSLWASWVPFNPEGESDVARTMFGLKYGF